MKRMPSMNTVMVNESQAVAYADMIRPKIRSTDQLPPSVRLGGARNRVQSASGGTSWLPFVRREYLEKDQISTFSALGLLDGSNSNPKLRASFVMPLKLVIHQLLYTRAYTQRGEV